MTEVIGPIDRDNWKTLSRLRASISEATKDKDPSPRVKARLKRERVLFDVRLNRFKTAA